MKTVFKLLLCISLLLNSACAPKPELSLSNDVAITAVFTQPEIESLENVLEFFEDAVISSQDTVSDNFSVLLRNYLQYIGDNYQSTFNYFLYLNFDDEKRQLLLSDLKSTGLFNELYYLDTVWYDKANIRYSHRSTDSLATVFIGVKRYGKYHQLLNELAKTDSIFGEFSETIDIAGDIAPWILGKMVYEYEDFDLSSKRIALIYALTFLSINEPLKIQK